jgi:hypothetical protein
MSYFSKLKQDVVESPGNSSTANLGAGATFTGTAQTTFGVAAIQINFKADQNCTIYVEQAPDAVPNWDISDAFTYYASKGGTGFTVQATGANVRVRVTNNGSSATTYLRLATVLCPIVEALPRSLSEEGNLKVGVYEIEGDFETRALVSPMNALKVTEGVKLVGTTFGDIFDGNFWVQTTASGSSTVTVSGGTLTLATGTTTGSSNIVNSQRTARYMAGSSNFYRGQIRLPAVTGANTRRWGAFNATNGYFFKHDGTTLSVVCRKGGVDTEVASGSFNGTLGATYSPDTNTHTYEMYWTNKSVWFFFDGVFLHKTTGSATTLTNTTHLQIGMECTNGANVNNNTLAVRVCSISRLGHISSNPTSARINTLATQVLKYGPGQVHRIIIGTLPVASGTVTIYDNTSAAGTVLWSGTLLRGTSSGGGVAANIPQSLDFGGLPFNLGLTVVTAGNAPDMTIIYE